MQPIRDKIRLATIRYASFACVFLMLALAGRAIYLQAPDVLAGCLLGVGLSIFSGYSTWRQDTSYLATYLICLYLIGFILLMVFIGYEDGVTSIWLLAIPPAAILVVGTIRGLWISAAFFLVLIYSLLFSELVPESAISEPFRYRLIVIYLISSVVCGVYAWIVDHYHLQLQAATEKIDQLEQLLPMCAHCKRVQVDDSWGTVESFISKETDRMVSHGICPDCAKENFPQFRAAE